MFDEKKRAPKDMSEENAFIIKYNRVILDYSKQI